MSFDIPKHAIPAFLRLAEKEDIAKNAWMWGQYMDSFSRPLFIENSTELFKSQREAHEAGFGPDSNDLSGGEWRFEFLTEMFKEGIHLQTDVADRLSVHMTTDTFVVSYQSIGRYRDWCWIDQRADECFPLNRPFEVMEALARRFKNPHDNRPKAG
ncbi:hypothetical protein D3C87_1030370 [compost metagenome]